MTSKKLKPCPACGWDQEPLNHDLTRRTYRQGEHLVRGVECNIRAMEQAAKADGLVPVPYRPALERALQDLKLPAHSSGLASAVVRVGVYPSLTATANGATPSSASERARANSEWHRRVDEYCDLYKQFTGVALARDLPVFRDSSVVWTRVLYVHPAIASAALNYGFLDVANGLSPKALQPKEWLGLVLLAFGFDATELEALLVQQALGADISEQLIEKADQLLKAKSSE